MDDFLKQLQMVKKMGSIKDLMGMIPGIGQAVKDMDVDDKQFSRLEAIMLSMTQEERNDANILDGSRRKRIAKGCGQTVQELNQFLNQYKMMQKLFSGMGKGGGMFANMKKMMGMGKKGLGGLGGGMPGMPGGMEMPAGMDMSNMPDMGDAPMPAGFGPSAEERKKMRQAKKDKKARRKRSRGK